jgi:hypothetical protein
MVRLDKRAGAGVPSCIMLLRDADGDGVAGQGRVTEGLISFGAALMAHKPRRAAQL